MADFSIPQRLTGRPTAGGLVIPWVTVILANGQPDWRACIRHRVDQCLTQGLCQLDGQPIGAGMRAVFFATHDQLPTVDGDPVITDVPPVHPECAPYATTHCPMLNGQRSTYANRDSLADGPRGHVCPDETCGCAGWLRVDDRDNAGQDNPTWFTVWARNWQLTQAPGGALMAVIHPTKVRPVANNHPHPTEETQP